MGNYWHTRLNFGEVDMYNKVENRTMSATRTLSRQQSQSRQTLESMLISLCTRLEQRMVKAGIFCKEVFFSIRYRDFSTWETSIKLADPVQDAQELRSYIKERITGFERQRNLPTIFTDKTTNLTVGIQSFVKDNVMQYSLFDNKIRKDKVRKVMYDIKEAYEQNNIVRKGCELFNPNVMKDAIGFGSVRDMSVKAGEVKNKFLLEEDVQGVRRMATLKKKVVPVQKENEYNDIRGDEEWKGDLNVEEM